jgi:hypothetical protein
VRAGETSFEGVYIGHICWILTNKEIYAVFKKPTVTETIRLHRLRWFAHVQGMKNKIYFTKGYIVCEFGNNKIER